MTGFVCEGRRTPRAGFQISADGRSVGEVTSGGFSPCLKRGIAMGYADVHNVSEGMKITLTDGKVEIGATVTRPPFV